MIRFNDDGANAKESGLILATLNDIAKIAGVNISTVSKALRGSSDINAQTVARIQRIADEMNYTRASQNGAELDRTPPVIGIVCPEVTSMYYASILNSLQLSLLDAGYQSMTMISNFVPAQEANCIHSLILKNVHGVVFFTENDAYAEYLREPVAVGGTAFVIISDTDSGDSCDHICIDDDQGVALAVDHLIGLKHTQIAYIGDTLSTKRRVSYIRTMENGSVSVNPDYVVENDLRFEECGYHGMKKLLALETPPTAVFAAYDNIAIGAMRAVYESGLSVPEDFSIVGIDNLRTSAYLIKSITSVNEPTDDLGELAASLMINRLRKKNAVRHIKLIPTLNIRETTAVLKI